VTPIPPEAVEAAQAYLVEQQIFDPYMDPPVRPTWVAGMLGAAAPHLQRQAADLLRKCADGREEYANSGPDYLKVTLQSEANTYRNAADLVSGDLSVAYSALPSWRWHELPPRAPSVQRSSSND
jgi:hypothetical protein